jgi:spermidine synthase
MTTRPNEEISTKPPYIDLVYSQRWDDNTKLSIKINRHIYTEQTPYQRIDFYESDTYGTFFTLDGLVMVTQKDEFIYQNRVGCSCSSWLQLHPSHRTVRTGLVYGSW